MRMHIKFVRILVLLSWLSGTLYAGEFITITHSDTAKHAMVVTAHPEATRIGLEILKKGGNAVDAAVATAFAVGVVEPHASGLGGGGGMLIYLREDKSLHYLDYYMQTSSQADTNYSNRNDLYTPRSICVPGTPAGLLTAHRLYGKLPLKDVISPAIRIARDGFVVSNKLYTNILDKLDVLSRFPQTEELFFRDDFPIPPGDTLRNPQLAVVLNRLLEEGEDYFYRGTFAKNAVKAIRLNGGYLSEKDFAAYRAIERKPVRINYKGYTILSSPPPQSGVTLLEILNIFQNAPLIQSHHNGFTDNPQMIHLLCAAIKRADMDRYHYLGDPAAFSIPVDVLLNKNYAALRFQDIDPQKVKYKHNTDIPAGNLQPFLKLPVQKNETAPIPHDGTHTTHISIVDPAGNAVSLTQTIGLFFGSGFSSQGVIFNSAMSLFYTRPSPNRIGPARRPLTTISPSLVFKNDRLAMVLGTPGGGRIFNVLAQILIDLIDFHLSPQQAMDAPRFSVRISSKQLRMEKGFSGSVRDSLQAMGYMIKTTESLDAYFGGVQLIVRDVKNNQLIGVSDLRRDGGAIGF